MTSNATGTATIESESNEIEAACAAIDSLREECQELTELRELEEHYSKEVVSQLKQIMMPLHSSFRINHVTILENDSSISGLVLTSEGIVCLLDDKGKVILRKPLSEFQAETVLEIIEEILPEVKGLVNDSQEKAIKRLSSVERISKELRKMTAQVTDQ